MESIVVIGKRDVGCRIIEGEYFVGMELRQLPVPCYGQNRGYRNYFRQSPIIGQLFLEICPENLEALKTERNRMECNSIFKIDEISFYMLDNEKSLNIVKNDWFQALINKMEARLNDY